VDEFEEDDNEIEPQVQAEMVEIFGDLGTYQTATCAVWRYGGPGFSKMQGFVMELPIPPFPDSHTSLEVSGGFECSDIKRTGSVLTGRGKAQVSYLLVLSRDGTNLNYRAVDQGVMNVTNGQCDGYGMFESVSVYGHVADLDSSKGAFVGLWLSLEFAPSSRDGDFVTICDDLQYRFQRGSPIERPIGPPLSAHPSESIPDYDDSLDTTASDPVMSLPADL